MDKSRLTGENKSYSRREKSKQKTNELLIFSKQSNPSNPLRYRFIILLIIIVILIMLLDKKSKLFCLKSIDVKGLIIYIVVVIIIFTVCMSRQGAEGGLSDNAWDGLHALFYFFLAYFVPNNYLPVATLMVAWELFEDFMGFNLGKTKWIETDGKKMKDMMANTTGYFLGNLAFRNGKVRKAVKGFFVRFRSSP